MEIIAGLLIGLAGSLHCVGMCGPIALALPGGPARGWRYVAGRGGYLLGRIATYAIIGAIVGTGVGAVTIAGSESIVSLLAGGMMVVTAVLQLAWHRSLLPQGPLVRMTNPVRHALQRLLQRHSVLALTGIGMLNGMLPCGLVLSAAFGSAAVGDSLGGAAFMVAFGLGTLPSMGVMSFGGGLLAQRLRSYRLVMPAVALLLGVLLLVRGMNLGIPMVSPKAPSPHQEANCCSQAAEQQH